MRLVAHRARLGEDPENSLLALSRLPAGLCGIEADVRVTSDDVPVMLHDAVLDRVTDGAGLVEETSFKALQLMRLKGTAESPAALVPFLQRAAANLWSQIRPAGSTGAPTVYLDFKTAQASAVAAIIVQLTSLPFRSGILCLCKETEVLAQLRAALPNARLGLLGCHRGNIRENLDAAIVCKAEVLFVKHGPKAFRENMALVPEIRAAGFEAGGSILNGVAALEMARAAGCNLVLTDLPAP